MKKSIKVVATLLSIITALSSSFVNVFAEEESVSSILQNQIEEPIIVTEENADQILLDFGVVPSQVKDMPTNEKLSMAQAIVLNPNKVSYVKTTNLIDEISYIEKVVNSTDEELLAAGITQEELTNNRKIISAMQNMSEQELLDTYKTNPEQIKMLKKAVTPNDKYQEKVLSGNIVTTSGEITNTEMDFILSSWEYNPDCKAVSYYVQVFFEWNYHYIWHDTDEIALTWGGNFVNTDINRLFFYDGYYPFSKDSVYEQGGTQDIFDADNRLLSRVAQDNGLLTFVECGIDLKEWDPNFTHVYDKCLKKVLFQQYYTKI